MKVDLKADEAHSPWEAHFTEPLFFAIEPRSQTRLSLFRARTHTRIHATVHSKEMHPALKAAALVLACLIPQGAECWVAPGGGFLRQLPSNSQIRLGLATAGLSALTKIPVPQKTRPAPPCHLMAAASGFGERGIGQEKDVPRDQDYGEKGASSNARNGQGGNAISLEDDFICPGTWYLESEVDCEVRSRLHPLAGNLAKFVAPNTFGPPLKAAD